MTLPIITGEFRVVEDPELKFTPQGRAVANVRLVASARKQDQQGNWYDDKILWISGSAWEATAEAIAATLSKGDLVVVHGALHTRSWENQSGEKRSATDLVIYSIGPSLKWDSYTKNQRPQQQGQQQQNQQPQQQQQYQPQQQPPPGPPPQYQGQQGQPYQQPQQSPWNDQGGAPF